MKYPTFSFWEIKVYRRRFIETVISIILIAFLCLAGSVSFFTAVWSGVWHQESQNQFIRMESEIASLKDNLSDYVNGLYRNRSLMQDAKALFEAEDNARYLEKRLENSRRSNQQIAYLPGNLRSFFIQGKVPVRKITLSSESGTKCLWYDAVSGDIHVLFGLKTEQGTDIDRDWGNFCMNSYEIRDMDLVTRRLGELSFWCSAQELFGMAELSGWHAVLQHGEILYPALQELEEEPKLQDMFLRAGSQETGQGSFFTKTKLMVFYTSFQSAQYECNYVNVITLWDLWRKNFRVLITLAITIFAITFGAISISFGGICHEAEFLSHIMQMLKSMESRNFSNVRSLGNFTSKNEYGMIADALADVSEKLEGFIETEYILKLKQQEAAMRALRTQINPHFLYNTLESIRAKALLEGAGETAEAVAQLGGLYRKLLHCPERISLAGEFELLEIYLKLMSLRFAGNFVYSLEMDEVVRTFITVSFWLQPLAENFFQHGIDRSSEFNLLIVEARLEEDKTGVRIIMSDNGLGIVEDRMEETRKNMYEGGDDPGADIGLRNVYTRLSYFYGDTFTMEIANQEEGGVRISLFLPYLRTRQEGREETLNS